MFPLLPIISDDLASLDPRLALRYQNTFMKNALIRGLNIIYLAASTINDGEHPNFREFTEYAHMVCGMIKLHLRGDDVFFTTPNSDGQTLTDILGEDCTLPSTIALQISSLDEIIQRWNKCPSSYTPSELLDILENVEEPIVTGMRKQVILSSQNRGLFFSSSGQVESIQGEYLIKAYSEAQMRAMIEGNVFWLAAQSDISILLPFCMSHHDKKTSKYWPTIPAEGLAALPELVKAHPSRWIFAPFDPVTGEDNILTL
ncbi:hypothetical protein K443DRAFT_651346 [Laccaria amethystina LaAM-08-1]|uniref:Uncharacterized protein n=1 Tax=Laccaria amethystina LaAM-08-1 TaxID=1095629 RepID=A0A0C9YMT4_9AGAR|nr:hypothetical protein K443DRAFT_651346 [Laccaria amethystina LaAM-08-1]